MQGQREPEAASLAGRAVHPDGPALRLDELFGDGQPKPATLAVFRAGHLEEALKYFSRKGRIDALAMVAHAELQCARSR